MPNRQMNERRPGATPRSIRGDAAALEVILPYALAQAERHREPVSLLCVAVDRLDAIRRLHGPGFAEAAVARVAETIGRLLRASDVVAPLGDGRVLVLLPDADVADAQAVGEAILAAVVGSGTPSPTMPLLTASIGAASYPAHARSGRALVAAAREALALAEQQGRNQVASASVSDSDPASDADSASAPVPASEPDLVAGPRLDLAPCPGR